MACILNYWICLQVAPWGILVLRWLDDWVQKDRLPFTASDLLACFTAWVHMDSLFDAGLVDVQNVLRLVTSHLLSPDQGLSALLMLTVMSCC